MTNHTITLTAEQAEDLFDCITVAYNHYSEKCDQLQRDLGAYDWRLSSVDMLDAHIRRRDQFAGRWMEFYQKIKVIRAARDGGIV